MGHGDEAVNGAAVDDDDDWENEEVDLFGSSDEVYISCQSKIFYLQSSPSLFTWH